MKEREFILSEDQYDQYFKEESKDYLKSEEDIASDLEQNILRMARQGATYKQIRLSLGNPSRQVIRNVIRNRDPELFKVLGNTKAVDKLRDKRFAEDGEIEDEDTA